MPEMTTRTAVPIARTGSYVLSTGPATFTEEDLAAAVAAYANDPAVHAPRIKIDGLAASFDPKAHGGEPSLGTATNLRLSANGQEVLADVTIPKWLDAVADFAYPNRSIEGAQGVKTATGQKHDLVITAVALLGVDLPGISTLPDLADLLANGPKADEAPSPEAIMAAAGWEGTPVHAGMDQDIVRRRLMEYIEEGADGNLPADAGPWDLWPIALRFDDAGNPYAKVLDEDSGRLYRVDITVSGNEVAFGDFIEVVEQDVPVAAAAGRSAGTVWASRADQRPTPEPEEQDMDIAALREAAGLTAEQLPDDASPEQITEAIRINAAADPTSTPSPDEGGPDATVTEPPVPVAAAAARPALPDGVIAVDKEEWETVKAGAAKAVEMGKAQAEEKRDAVVAAAMKAGRFAPSRKAHYEKAWERDPEGTLHLLTASADDGGLAENLVPVMARGAEPQAEGAADSNQGTGLFDFGQEG